MIKVEPVEFDNFTMSHISDEENNFDCIVAISTKDSDTIPLAEIRFESFNSINQQIDVTKKYARSTVFKYAYNDIKNAPAVITININENTKHLYDNNCISNTILAIGFCLI